jgi:hypothetical protein
MVFQILAVLLNFSLRRLWRFFDEMVQHNKGTAGPVKTRIRLESGRNSHKLPPMRLTTGWFTNLDAVILQGLDINQHFSVSDAGGLTGCRFGLLIRRNVLLPRRIIMIIYFFIDFTL